MKVAVSSMGKGLASQVSPVFGRCPWFVIVETDGKKITGHKDVKNASAMQAGSAGIMAAQQAGNDGAEAVISGAVGPRAFAVFSQLGITAYQSIAGTVEGNVKALLEGKLQPISAPGAMGLGMGRGLGLGMGMGRRGGRGGGFGRGRRFQ